MRKKECRESEGRIGKERQTHAHTDALTRKWRRKEESKMSKSSRNEFNQKFVKFIHVHHHLPIEIEVHLVQRFLDWQLNPI